MQLSARRGRRDRGHASAPVLRCLVAVSTPALIGASVAMKGGRGEGSRARRAQLATRAAGAARVSRGPRAGQTDGAARRAGPRVGRGALLEAVEALRRRSLAERTETSGAAVGLWDVDQRQLVTTFVGHTGGVWAVAVSRNGQ